MAPTQNRAIHQAQDRWAAEEREPREHYQQQNQYGLVQCLLNAFLGPDWHTPRNL